MNTKWFYFDQNNSGGSFDHKPVDGIGYGLFIEATDKDHAIERAEHIGLYFDGCDSGMDCSCCGDRWYRPWDDGTDKPQRYGEEWRPVADAEEPDLEWGLPLYIHEIGGQFKAAKKAAR
jgi:hypothetical protein